MPRRLLNIASIVCLVLCVALIGMWVRSYTWMDEFNFTPGRTTFGFGSASGRIAMGVIPAIKNPGRRLFEVTHCPFADWRRPAIDYQFSTVAENGLARDNNVFAFAVPYWFVVLIVGALSFAPWPRVTYRFSLRTLLIATTILAVVMGLIAWLDRAWFGK